MPGKEQEFDSVRSSRAGHAFHEQWAARRALQLVFPNDDLSAIAVEGLSYTETAEPGEEAADVADLILYYGGGDNFSSCSRLETLQFKYKERDTPVSASYLAKTISKFADSLVGYEKDFSTEEIDKKLSFGFITNAEFSDGLWDAIAALRSGSVPSARIAADQAKSLATLCRAHGVSDPSRLFSRTAFHAAEKDLPAQINLVRRMVSDWSAGADGQAKSRILGLQDLVARKAGPAGRRNNLILREDVLVALDCEPDDLFPAETRFVDIGAVVERSQLPEATELISGSTSPIFIHAEGGVGKTVFVQSLAAKLTTEFEVVVFDCFGGGSYRSHDEGRHLPKVGLVQIVNELAARGLGDPLLPSDSDRIGLIKAARRRLSQAAKAVSEQSAKRGVVIILDAADNAQVEADFRKEDAFPKLLLATLSEKPIDGVRLVLTARTHRMKDVVGRSNIAALELGPFTDAEARQFLSARREGITEVEFATAIRRSGRNARVLDYLVKTWDANIAGNSPKTELKVEQIIAQQCEKIFADLVVAGWTQEEVREFFAAISLLPPPIPLEELARALGWSGAQVRSAASDLAPMLELVSHGAIFRDEPTETFIRETYAEETGAQQAIAKRLFDAQPESEYAAEALPRFLVVIGDGKRAYELAESKDFPKSIRSDFGRRRLTLARLHAAFRLAVTAKELDRVLRVTVKLAQVAGANAKGDQFIRRSPELAIMLGEPDAYRRLVSDRSGWRGARSARLTTVYCFAGEPEEAAIQAHRTIGWINWQAQNAKDADDELRERGGPGYDDFAAVMFQSVLRGDFEIIDRNLGRWERGFSLSAGRELLSLIHAYDRHTGATVLSDLADFASSERSQSFVLKACLLAAPELLDSRYLNGLARSAGKAKQEPTEKGPRPYDSERQLEGSVVGSALSGLLYGSREVARRILSQVPNIGPSSYEYSERYGHSRAWLPILRICVGVWAKGKRLARSDLLPRDVKTTRKARQIEDAKALSVFIGSLKNGNRRSDDDKRRKPAPKPQFNDRERDEICAAIELVLNFAKPLEDAILQDRRITGASVEAFLSTWSSHLRPARPRFSDDPRDLLARDVGLGFARIMLRHAIEFEPRHADELLKIISSDRFTVSQKTGVLSLMCDRPGLQDVSGGFAAKISADIRSDDQIEQRGENYAALARALISLSIDEAREYYRQGLAELDQMGGEDYDQIHSLLHFAATQRGGTVRPELGQRLMNLCQTIVQNDSHKFWWALFGRAAARSVGLSAAYKLLRWDDQDIADFDLGLPQLACYLAKEGRLDARRAAFLVTLSQDHGWYEWPVGEGLGDLLSVADPQDRKALFDIVYRKLEVEHAFGDRPMVWESLREVVRRFPETVAEERVRELDDLLAKARQKRDEKNDAGSSRDSFSVHADASTEEARANAAVSDLLEKCDPSSSADLDDALRKIESDKALPYYTKSRFLDGLVAACPFQKRLALMLAICEASSFDLDEASNLVVKCAESWRETTAHIIAKSKDIVERLFEIKGSTLFDLPYASVTRYVAKLAKFCGDERFVVDRILRTVALEQVELDGDEWLQLATALCDHASPEAGLDALEHLLSGSGLRIADDIGEGPFQQEWADWTKQDVLVPAIVWHLLGDDDGYVRWSTARGLLTLCDLRLVDDIDGLIAGFDRTGTPPLTTRDKRFAFQNAQQWLLMGLARAAIFNKEALLHIEDFLWQLSARNDLHVVLKLQIARCLRNLHTSRNEELEALWHSVKEPRLGHAEYRGWPAPVESKSGFRFDYEFNKHEISGLARLFAISEGEATDAVAAAIVSRWPEARDLDYFGHSRYRRDDDDRYEFFAEQVQKHALLEAATKLAQERPVASYSYEVSDTSPWLEWLRRSDITFDDGSWLSDRKDAVPEPARASLLGHSDGKTESLQDQQTLFEKLALVGGTDAPIPIFGNWSSPDNVHVSIVSALAHRRGAIGTCESFAKRSGHDLWLPQFWDSGYFERRHHQENPFEPFVWSPTSYGLGIDTVDEIAARSAADRPRLGIETTEHLGLISDPYKREWRDGNGTLALRSDAWGRWRHDPNSHRQQHVHDDGEILWAEPRWLDDMTRAAKMCLVTSINLTRYPSTRDYDQRTGAKAVYLVLRLDDGALRVWHAKKASILKRDY